MAAKLTVLTPAAQFALALAEPNTYHKEHILLTLLNCTPQPPSTAGRHGGAQSPPIIGGYGGAQSPPIIGGYGGAQSPPTTTDASVPQHIPAILELAALYKSLGRTLEMHTYYTMAANLGNTTALIELALYYKHINDTTTMISLLHTAAGGDCAPPITGGDYAPPCPPMTGGDCDPSSPRTLASAWGSRGNCGAQPRNTPSLNIRAMCELGHYYCEQLQFHTMLHWYSAALSNKIHYYDTSYKYNIILHRIGYYYQYIARNYTLMRQYYNDAITHFHNAHSMINLSKYYKFIHHTPTDGDSDSDGDGDRSTKANTYYELAINTFELHYPDIYCDDGRANFILGYFYHYEQPTPSLMLKYYNRAIKLNNVLALVDMANYYLYTSTPRHTELALLYYNTAIQSNCSRAMVALAHYYISTDVTSATTTKIRQLLYNAAISFGNKLALIELIKFNSTHNTQTPVDSSDATINQRELILQYLHFYREVDASMYDLSTDNYINYISKLPITTSTSAAADDAIAICNMTSLSEFLQLQLYTALEIFTLFHGTLIADYILTLCHSHSDDYRHIIIFKNKWVTLKKHYKCERCAEYTDCIPAECTDYFCKSCYGYIIKTGKCTRCQL
jgi:tetratricopeptide (TPR) repeat protein